MDRYANQRKLGFRTCAYGNLFEFGWNVRDAWPNMSKSCEGALDNSTTLLCHTRRLLEQKYAAALLHDVRREPDLVCGGVLLLEQAARVAE